MTNSNERHHKRDNMLSAFRGLGFFALAVASVWAMWWFTGQWRGFLSVLSSLWMFPVLFGILAIEQFDEISGRATSEDTSGSESEVDWHVDETGIAIHEVGAPRQYQMRYEDLVRVEIVTTDGGPFVEDFFYELSDGESWLTIPLGLACDLDLVDHLFALPGFDHSVVIQASGSTENRRFVAWEADWGTDGRP